MTGTEAARKELESAKVFIDRALAALDGTAAGKTAAGPTLREAVKSLTMAQRSAAAYRPNVAMQLANDGYQVRMTMGSTDRAEQAARSAVELIGGFWAWTDDEGEPHEVEAEA